MLKAREAWRRYTLQHRSYIEFNGRNEIISNSIITNVDILSSAIVRWIFDGLKGKLKEL